jgi:transposase-like protein
VIALRTINCLEPINEEFRRRTKTQVLLPSQDAVLLLLFGLLAQWADQAAAHRRLAGDGERENGISEGDVTATVLTKNSI